MAARPRKKPAPKKPAPLTLKGSKLEDFLPLLPAEEKLRQCAAKGKDCIADDFSGARPEEATKLNTIRAEFLRYMILGGCEKSPISSRGIRAFGIYITCPILEGYGQYLDLEAAIIKNDLCLVSSVIDGGIILINANTKSIVLTGSSIKELRADGITVDGSIYLRDGFLATGFIRITSGRILGSLSCGGGLALDSKVSMFCDNLEVHKGVFLDRGFTAKGSVLFLGAKIIGDFACVGGKFKDKDISLRCDGINVQGSIYLKNKFYAQGGILFGNAKITGSFECDNSKFCSSLNLQNASIRENLWLSNHFTIDETVNLQNTRVGGNLNLKDSIFTNTNNSLIANRAKIEGDVDLENVIAKGTIALTGTEIGGDFTPQGASLEGTPALQLRNTKIGGTLVWRSLKHANGEVDFSGATCSTINTDGDSWMRKREAYHDKRQKAETTPEEAETKKVENNTKLDNFTYGGFSNLPDNCKPAFWIEFLNQQPQDHLEKNFKPRPWEQLASVLDTMGYQEEALELRIEKQKLQTNFMASHEPIAKSGLNLWHWGQVFFRKFIWGPLVGYGYKPGNALVYLFALIMLGTIIYDQAAKRGIMTPTHPLIFKEARAGGSIPAWCAENWVYFPDENCTSAMPSEYSEFQSFIYAADVALPVVNLRMESDWAPRVVFTDGARDNFGWWVRIYEWFLIAAGWILSLLFVSAVGSSIRK